MSAVAARGDAYGLKLEDHLRVEIISRGSVGEALYEQLKLQRDKIEAAIGEPLTWYEPATGHQPRIYVSKRATVTDPNEWPQLYHWLLEKLDTFEPVFRPIVQELDAAAD